MGNRFLIYVIFPLRPPLKPMYEVCHFRKTLKWKVRVSNGIIAIWHSIALKHKYAHESQTWLNSNHCIQAGRISPYPC